MTNPLNPLDLHGPAFLAFYAAVGIVTIVALVVRRRRQETTTVSATSAAGEPLADPYAVAYLRGGGLEAVRVAVATLLDRGAIVADGKWLSPAPGSATAAPSHVPLEHAVLAYVTPGPGYLNRAMDDLVIRVALRSIEDTLIGRGLLPTPEQEQGRRRRCVRAGVLLWMVAIAQIANRDPRYGIGFLVLLAIGFTAIAAWVSFRRRTAAGDRVVEDMQVLLQGQRDALAAQGEVHVPALVLAVFGLAVLPSAAQALARRVVPPQTSTLGSSGGCSSSGGSGWGGSGCGGSSCGGGGSCGGCGGGCGGCGGCGG
jgi:uncharacterized protein (TIGR04222 family)